MRSQAGTQHLSQPISNSFAIVNVAGGERVKVLLDNQDAGTTDRNGVLVIANLRTSELDRDGHFYLEDVTAGSYSAILRYGGGECRFIMEIPRTTGIEANIGAFTCARS